jgi:low temperature requirement protein LtrA
VGRAGVASRFEATLLHVGRWQAHWMLLAVMLAGLFMNAAIAMPSTPEGAFLIPLLGIQAGRSILMMVAASTRMLRGHYARLLCWILVTAPLWLAGTTAEAASRLRWWPRVAGIAALVVAGACPTCSLPMERWGWWPPCCSRSSSSSSASRI